LLNKLERLYDLLFFIHWKYLHFQYSMIATHSLLFNLISLLVFDNYINFLLFILYFSNNPLNYFLISLNFVLIKIEILFCVLLNLTDLFEIFHQLISFNYLFVILSLFWIYPFFISNYLSDFIQRSFILRTTNIKIKKITVNLSVNLFISFIN